MNRLKNVRRLMGYLGSWLSSMSSGIRYLVMEKSFPDTNMRPLVLHSISLRPSFPELINYKPTHNQPYCVPHLRNEIKVFKNRQTTTQLIGIFALVILLIWYFHRVYINTGLMSPHEYVWLIEGDKICIWQHDSCATQGGVYTYI